MLKWGALGFTMLLMVACSEESGTSADKAAQSTDNTLMRVISGEVWYRQRMALPRGATVQVVLEDQSRMDVPAEKVTGYTYTVNGQGPYTYRLVFDPRSIKDNMRYGLRARIEHDGNLLFTSTEYIDPFATEPGTPVKIMVSQVGGTAAD